MLPENLIATYGYLALFLGTIIEGESFLIAAAGLAGYGYMHFPQIYLVAVAGAVTGDQFFFTVGRYRGRRILQRKPTWSVQVERAFRLTSRYHTLLVLIMRLLYGFRMVLPFAMGVGGFDPKRFLILDLIGSLTWVAVISLIGYGFGNIFQAATSDTGGHWVGLAIGFCFACGALAYGLRIFYRMVFQRICDAPADGEIPDGIPNEGARDQGRSPSKPAHDADQAAA